jgi:hypothetical protein
MRIGFDKTVTTLLSSFQLGGNYAQLHSGIDASPSQSLGFEDRLPVGVQTQRCAPEEEREDQAGEAAMEETHGLVAQLGRAPALQADHFGLM